MAKRLLVYIRHSLRGERGTKCDNKQVGVNFLAIVFIVIRCAGMALEDARSLPYPIQIRDKN